MPAFAAGLAAGLFLGVGACWWLWRAQNKTMGRFFSFAAHEINTPITAVNMTILNLLSGVFGEVPPDQLQWVEMMREQLVRLNCMVGELRDLIHLQLHDDLFIHSEDFDTAEAIETALRGVRTGCAHAGIPLEAVVPEGLPKVHADPDRLPRIMTSLLFHARKFRTSGAVSVSVQPRQDGKRVEFCVEYHGPALTPAEAKRTLDLYFPARQRGDQSLTATGLGLGVLRALMRLQGGDLEHETDGKGRSRLRLSIPANP